MWYTCHHVFANFLPHFCGNSATTAINYNDTIAKFIKMGAAPTEISNCNGILFLTKP